MDTLKEQFDVYLSLKDSDKTKPKLDIWDYYLLRLIDDFWSEEFKKRIGESEWVKEWWSKNIINTPVLTQEDYDLYLSNLKKEQLPKYVRTRHLKKEKVIDSISLNYWPNSSKEA